MCVSGRLESAWLLEGECNMHLQLSLTLILPLAVNSTVKSWSVASGNVTTHCYNWQQPKMSLK